MQEIRDVGKPIHILHNMLKRELEAANSRTDITGAQGRIIQFLVDTTEKTSFPRTSSVNSTCGAPQRRTICTLWRKTA